MSRRRIVAPEASEHQRSVDLQESAPNVPGDQESEAHERALKRAELRKKYSSTSDEVAESTVFFRNWKWDAENKHHPDSTEALERFVTKYYPYAIGGPLYVDEPTTQLQLKRSLEKQKKLRKLGLRVIVVQLDTTYFQALEQLDPMGWEKESA